MHHQAVNPLVGTSWSQLVYTHLHEQNIKNYVLQMVLFFWLSDLVGHLEEEMDCI